MEIELSLSLLGSGESSIVIFTRGPRLIINSDGTGSSGNWVINRSRTQDRVIIYHRPSDELPLQADIYIADYVDTVVSPDPRRSIVLFRDAKLVGTTNRNWHEFADTGAGPIRYQHK